MQQIESLPSSVIIDSDYHFLTMSRDLPDRPSDPSIVLDLDIRSSREKRSFLVQTIFRQAAL